ncbi:MAG: hypothetical protein LBL37_00550 [Gracilibacteraceae bacterium]|nr:hypothetical protein [Gracilibacteraceae bacterium]
MIENKFVFWFWAQSLEIPLFFQRFIFIGGKVQMPVPVAFVHINHGKDHARTDRRRFQVRRAVAFRMAKLRTVQIENFCGKYFISTTSTNHSAKLKAINRKEDAALWNQA